MAQKIKIAPSQGKRVTQQIKIDLEAEKSKLTKKEALELLSSHKERGRLRVHTFQNMGFGLMGCDWDLKDVKAKFKLCAEDEIALSGSNMKGMGHGVAFWEVNRGWTFLETDNEKIDAIHKLRNIK